MRDNIEQNTFNPIKLYISDKGELTDYNKNTYKVGKCVVLSIKSSPAEYKGKEYTKNQALLLIEQEQKIIFATAVLSTYIINNDSWWNCSFSP